MLYTLRPATDDDYELLYTILKQTMRPYVEAIWGWDERVQRQIYRNRWNPALWQVIQINGVDAGRLSVEDYDEYLYLDNIQILPEFQGHGLGEAVVRDVLALAGDKSVRLSVLRGNPAKRLYDRLWFEVTHETEERIKMEWQPAGIKKANDGT